MKQKLNEQFTRMQKLAGIITENQINEAKKINLTPVQKKEFFNAIKDLSAQEDFEYALGEAGNVLANILTNGEAEYIEDVEDFGYDADEVEQYAMNLAGESKLNKNQIQEMDMDVKTILDNNGIDDDYFESMGEKAIETGTEEWLDVLSDVTGKDAYTAEFDKEDEAKIQAFMQKLEALGIELI